MKQLLYILLPLSLVVYSCKMKEMDPEVEPGEIKISVSAKEMQNSTKAKATDGFVEDSQIGIFSAVEANPTNPVRKLDETTTKDFNFIYQANKNSTYWDPVASSLFFDPYKNITLYSYYPASTMQDTPNTIELSSNGYVVKYKAITDQSTSANLQLADLMYAQCANVSNVNRNVTLPFTHKLTKIRFSIMKDNSWGATAVKLTSVSVSGANIYTQANLSIVDGVLTPVANGQVNEVKWSVDPRVPVQLSSIVAYDVDLIIVPTSYIGTTINFVANDKTFEYVLDKEGNFQEATNHTYKVTIMPAGAAQPIVIEPSIVDWEVNSGIVIKPR